MKAKKNILITGVGGRSVGSGILHSLLRSESVSKNQWNIFVSDADTFSWGLYLTPNRIITPLANTPGYIEFMANHILQNKIDAVIPGTEIETEILLKNSRNIPCPIIANSVELIPLMMDKFLAEKKLRELNLDYIETLPLASWKTIVNKYGFPVIVKPTRGTGASRGLNLIINQEELDSILNSYDKTSYPCIQPYLGTEEGEYTVGVLSDKAGAIIDSIVLKRKLVGLSLLQSKKNKRKSFAISTGYSQGYFVKDEQIQSFCETLAMKLKSKGPLNIQLRKHENKIYVFEIHPRFSGTTTFRADVGFNEPDILLQNRLNDKKFARLNYRYDVACIRAFEHIIVPMHQML